MPKDTFFNIKEEKQEMITRAAIREFAEHGLSGASVNRIVKSASIATGSFYQYFEDLDDLFIHVAIRIANMKIEYMQREFDALEEKNLDTLIHAIYRGGIRFAMDNELFCKISNDIPNIRDRGMIEKVSAQVKRDDLFPWLISTVQSSIEKGEMIEGMTFELFYALLLNINQVIFDYLSTHKQNGTFSYTGSDMDQLSTLATRILLHGIKKQED